MNVSRVVAAQIMRDLDPLVVDARRRRALKIHLYYGKSPNKIWYLDGYDKFNPFGFTIQGCIDGYGRSVLWSNTREVCNVFVNDLTILKKFHGKLL